MPKFATVAKYRSHKKKKNAHKPYKTSRKPTTRSRVGRVPRPIQSAQGMQTQSTLAHSIKHTMKRGLAMLGAPCTYVVSNPLLIDNSDSYQGVSVVGQWYSTADLKNIANTVPQPTSVAAGIQPVRFHVNSLLVEMTFANASSGTQILDLYDVMYLQDTPRPDPSGAMYNVSTPLNAWSAGMVNQVGTAGLITNAIFLLGALPTDSELFRDFYKVVRKTSVVMAQASSHVHKLNIKHPRNFDLNEMSTNYLAKTGLAHYTMATLAVVRGQPAYDPSSTVTTAMAPNIRCIVTERYQYSWVQPAGSAWYWASNIPVTTGASTAQIVNVNNPILQDPVYG